MTFEEQYKQLNKKQREAVDAIEGPVMVVAGPGTGKTSILTLRIANILKRTDTAPDSILALTFTESGVSAMKKKLVNLIGTAGYKVNINTFHGFCNEIIKQYPERFPRIIGSQAITDIDQIAIMEKIIESRDLEFLKPYGDIFFYVKPVLAEIRNLKREAIGVNDFAKIIAKQKTDFANIPNKVQTKGVHQGKMKGGFIKLKERIEKNKELLKLYAEYEKSLLKEKYYDFEDKIVEVIKTLRQDNDLLLILQENNQYILADEHQDANNSQNKILELISGFHKNPNLFIVGDEKQAIFRFQGASLENFLYFKKIYPKAIIINLEENYRSTQTILDASHSLISKNIMPKDFLRIALKSKIAGKEPIKIVATTNFDAEYDFLVKDMQEKIKSGVKPDEMAVLYRDNKDAFPVVQILKKTNIPFQVESDDDILKDENIRKLLLIFESINNLTDEEKLGAVLFIDFLKLSVIDIYKIFDLAKKEKKKLIDIVIKKFPIISQKLSRWSNLAHNKSFLELFEIIIKESGYLEFSLSNPDSLERLAILETFWGEIRRLAGAKKEYFLKDFIEHLERVREHGILTKTSKGIIKAGVHLMTAHKSKGLEFDYIFIIGANDKHWSNKIRRTYFNTDTIAGSLNEGNIDDERRLFYVALTRARKGVTITYAKENNEGRELLPTQFIGEIADKFKKTKTADNNPASFLNLKEFTHRGNKEINNKEYLQKLFLEQGLSVTALNNYLKCPWEYFFVNLIRLPQSPTKHQMYGTAIHETLKTFFDKYKVEEDLNKKSLLKLFEFNLNQTLLSPLDYKDSLKKGRQALTGYFETYKNTWSRNILNEYDIRGGHLTADKFELLLRGKLDKIEFLTDREVKVIDYKTGKRKSAEKENYRRQLVFYKLLLNLDEQKKYLMKFGELDFIEPDDKGKYKKDSFEITIDEVKELTKLVKEKAKEIYELAFWDKKCDDKKCPYCALRDMMKDGSK